MRSLNARTLLALLCAFLAGMAVFRILSFTATSAHPVGMGARISGMFVFLIAVPAVYGIVRHGWRDELARTLALLAIAGTVGTSFHWVPAAWVITIAAILGILFLLFRTSGMKWFAALAITLAVSFLGFFLSTLATSAFVRCDPQNRWLCDLAGFTMHFLAASIACAGYVYGRKTALRIAAQRTPYFA